MSERRSKTVGRDCCDKPAWSYATMSCTNCGCRFLYDAPEQIPAQEGEPIAPGREEKPPGG